MVQVQNLATVMANKNDNWAMSSIKDRPCPKRLDHNVNFVSLNITSVKNGIFHFKKTR